MTFTYLFSQVKYFITWFRKFTLCKASKNDTNCVETETPKWTWDMWQKDFDPSLHKNMSPFWWTKKRGLFLPPSLPYGPMSPSPQFFFEGIPEQKLEFTSIWYGHQPYKIDLYFILIRKWLDYSPNVLFNLADHLHLSERMRWP